MSRNSLDCKTKNKNKTPNYLPYYVGLRTYQFTQKFQSPPVFLLLSRCDCFSHNIWRIIGTYEYISKDSVRERHLLELPEPKGILNLSRHIVQIFFLLFCNSCKHLSIKNNNFLTSIRRNSSIFLNTLTISSNLIFKIILHHRKSFCLPARYDVDRCICFKFQLMPVIAQKLAFVLTRFWE